MNRSFFQFVVTLFVCVAWQHGHSTVLAVSPAGRLLFEQNWTSRDPRLGSDGVGPLFNGWSCVACHHQGGVGGGGDARFNAVSLGIESIEFVTAGASDKSLGTTLSRDEIAQHVRNVYAGFIRPDGSIMNTAALPHRGGSKPFHQLRERLHSMVTAERSEEGGPPDADEVRVANEGVILFSNRIDGVDSLIRARFFQRNTTPLFGSGLIDSIPDVAIARQAHIQQRHSEISGRVSILRDGTVGRFGWRANVNRLVNFVDRACANELGLETNRRAQGIDPTQPSYRNPSIDINDTQVKAMGAFVAQLPAPRRSISEDPETRSNVALGERAFEQIGCAVCHVPNLGTANGLYSDLLLHDMGPLLYDFDAAEPYIIRQQLVNELREIPIGSSQTIGYYGRSTSLDDFDVLQGSDGRSNRVLKAPRRSTATSDFVSIDKSNELLTADVFRGKLNRFSTRTAASFREEIGIRRRLMPSNTSQEWRTAPLWGLRDSAPYMHDGRARTVLEAISHHGGEAAGTRDRFLNLSLDDRTAVLAFMDTLVAPVVATKPFAN